MSFVALVVTDPNVDVRLIKGIHVLSGRSLVDIKKAVEDTKPLVIVNMLKSTERDEVKIFLDVLDLCDRERIGYQLIKNNQPIDSSSLVSESDSISKEAFSKLLERAKLVELQTQELVDREVGDLEDD